MVTGGHGGGAEPAHTNHPNFHLKERLVNLRRRECFVCLPYYYFMPLPKAKFPNFSARQYLRICKFLCLSLRGQNGGVFERKMWQYKSRDTQTQKKFKCQTSIFLNLHSPSWTLLLYFLNDFNLMLLLCYLFRIYTITNLQ